MKETQPHIAIIPTPGMGHIIPLTELAKQLTEFNFCITILIPNDGSLTSKPLNDILLTLPSHIISHQFLPPVDFSDLPSDTDIETRIILTLTRSIPAIRDSLRVMTESTRLVALIVDLFGSPIFDLAHEYGILPYLFFTCSGLALCTAFSFPKLDKMYACEYRELPEPVQLFPGSVLVHGIDLPDPVQDKKKESYKAMLGLIEQYYKASGILVNSFSDLEPVVFKYLMENDRYGNNFPPVYPIGPVIRTCSKFDLDNSCYLKWLDEQPSNSVLYVSFGSGGNLSYEQFVELALGLELSGQRFLWVVKTPHDKANASYFGVNYSDNPIEYLPQGFLDRTKGLGFVVPSWAHQVQILSHDSIGGFLTHCGWNSTLESIFHGVPLIAWPLFAEQRLNSVLVSEDIKVALRVKPNEKGLISRDQIVQHAKSLIQGEEGKILREKMKVLMHLSNVALNEDGSSKQSLTKVAKVLMNHKR
ncbi:unnamed protein product [Amaranthus hypochondriacus]